VVGSGRFVADANLLPFLERVCWIDDDAVFDTDTLQDFESRPIIAPNGYSPETHLVVWPDDCDARAFLPKEHRIHRDR
jgi:hypothetical protein